MLASCWICLEEGPDEGGKPLRRDCSCRGDSAGFAHLSCIINFAKSKCEKQKKAWEDGQPKDPNKLSESWCTCPNCKQNYQNELHSELADAFCSYARTSCPGDSFILLTATLSKFTGIPIEDWAGLQGTATEIFSLIEQLTLTYQGFCISVASDVYLKLGIAASLRGDSRGAMQFLEQSRNAAREMGNDDKVKRAEIMIAKHQEQDQRRRGQKTIRTAEDRRMARERYESTLARLGENNDATHAAQVSLAIMLHEGYHSIEAQKLCLKLHSNHRRVHGPNHDETRKMEQMIAVMSWRKVSVKTENKTKGYYLLRYEGADNEKCIVQGPSAEPRNISNEKSFTVNTKDVVALPGTPVICIGLKNANHLNGKLGDVRSIDEKTGRLAIHFEDKIFKSCLVRPENVRIVFNLTEEG